MGETDPERLSEEGIVVIRDIAAEEGEDGLIKLMNLDHEGLNVGFWLRWRDRLLQLFA
jgi:hypothetical protein